MLKQRTLVLIAAIIVLGIATGFVLAEGFRETPPAPALSAVTLTPPSPTSQPSASASPTRQPTPLPSPTTEPTPSASPTSRPTVSPSPTSQPTPSVPPATPSPEAAFTEYTVEAGDTLMVIARRFGVSVEEILAANSIPNPDSLEVGQVLRIPAAADGSGFIEYTVQQGDILVAIARRFGVSVEEILAVNNIPNPSSLEVGQVLRIPTP